MVYSASSVSEITGGEGKRPQSLNRTIRVMELVVEVVEADDGLVWDPQESTVRRRKTVALAASRLSLWL